VFEANSIINKKTNKNPLDTKLPIWIGNKFLSMINDEIITKTAKPINWLKGIGCTPGIVNLST
jgi:hypothetical protein